MADKTIVGEIVILEFEGKEKDPRSTFYGQKKTSRRHLKMNRTKEILI